MSRSSLLILALGVAIAVLATASALGGPALGFYGDGGRPGREAAALPLAAAQDADEDGIADQDDSCPYTAEDLDQVDDNDGCPETDVGILSVVKERVIVTSAGVATTTDIALTLANNGNYPSDLVITLLLRSHPTKCVARWLAKPGDAYVQDIIGDLHLSEIDRTEGSVLPGQTVTLTRTYSVLCPQDQSQPRAILMEIGVVPSYPVAEESGKALDNVHKQFIDVVVGPLADIEKVSMSASAPTLLVGQSASLTIHAVLHNNGPSGPVEALDSLEAAAPEDCTVDPPSYLDQPLLLPASVDVALDFGFTLTCNSPSFHEFTFRDTLTPADSDVADPAPDNNASTLVVVVPVLAQSDVKVTDLTISAAATAQRNAPFSVTVQAAVHNNGPFGPAASDILLDLALPTDCTRSPDGPLVNTGSLLPLSVPLQVQKSWAVTCVNVSHHSLAAAASITLTGIHLTDPEPGNNSTSVLAATAITDTADIKVTSWDCQQDDLPAVEGCQVLVTAGAPAQPPFTSNSIPPQPRTFVTIETLHNNGPFGPATVGVQETVNVQPGGPCLLQPPQQDFSIVLAVSSSLSDGRTWMANWTDPAFEPPFACPIAFRKTLALSTLHVSDTSLSNNTALLPLTLVRDADGDTVPDDFEGIVDNCPFVPNSDQSDNNDDGLGDACQEAPLPPSPTPTPTPTPEPPTPMPTPVVSPQALGPGPTATPAALPPSGAPPTGGPPAGRYLSPAALALLVAAGLASLLTLLRRRENHRAG